MNLPTQGEPFDWVKARNDCSIDTVFDRLRLGVQGDVVKRERIRASSGADPRKGKFTFASNIGRFSASFRTHDNEGSVIIFTLRRNRIVITNDQDEQLMSATVTISDDRECRIVVDGEQLEEWQFRKRALETLFFGEMGRDDILQE
jgi:hypothetical protein